METADLSLEEDRLMLQVTGLEAFTGSELSREELRTT